MPTRRRKKPDGPDWDNLKKIGMCEVEIDMGEGKGRPCGFFVYETPGGSCCRAPNGGHGGAPFKSLEDVDEAIKSDPDRWPLKARTQIPADTGPAREITTRPDQPFEVRDGDRLTIMYQGCKLTIAKYSTIELDAGIYSRTLAPGDDPVAEWDRIHGYLKGRALAGAREKLATFADELAKATKRAKG